LAWQTSHMLFPPYDSTNPSLFSTSFLFCPPSPSAVQQRPPIYRNATRNFLFTFNPSCPSPDLWTSWLFSWRHSSFDSDPRLELEGETELSDWLNEQTSVCLSRLEADLQKRMYTYMCMNHLYRRGAQTHRHAVGGYQVSGYSAGWRLCLTDWPSYINLTDAGSGSNKASWPHTGMHSHKEADAHTHRDRFYSHNAFTQHMDGRKPTSKQTHTRLTSITNFSHFHSGIKTPESFYYFFLLNTQKRISNAKWILNMQKQSVNATWIWILLNKYI